jgi:hypothetical protein
MVAPFSGTPDSTDYPFGFVRVYLGRLFSPGQSRLWSRGA